MGPQKKGHSTELLLPKMTEDWRLALDKNYVMGVVFVDLRKAFDATSHTILLTKTSRIWYSWGPLALDRKLLIQLNTSNGCKWIFVASAAGEIRCSAKLGNWSNSFSLFCNDHDGDAEIHNVRG